MLADRRGNVFGDEEQIFIFNYVCENTHAHINIRWW